MKDPKNDYFKSAVLITGGAGFVGSHLAEKLISLGASVRVVDDFSSGREENLSGIKGSVRVVKGDVRDRDIIEPAVDGCSTVFHLAAIPSVDISMNDPEGTHDVNLSASLQLFKVCGEFGVKNVVFASSSAVYGVPERLPIAEEHPVRPISHYGIQKLACEHYGFVFSQEFGYRFVALRFFNIYGPRQNPKGPYAAVIPMFAQALLEDRAPVIFGDGLQTRDFVYVSDAVDALLLAGASRTSGFFNIASGNSSNVIELADLLRQIIGGPEPVHTSERSGDIKHSWADISLAKKHLDYDPSYTLEEGLKRYVEWVRASAQPAYAYM